MLLLICFIIRTVASGAVDVAVAALVVAAVVGVAQLLFPQLLLLLLVALVALSLCLLLLASCLSNGNSNSDCKAWFKANSGKID